MGFYSLFGGSTHLINPHWFGLYMHYMMERYLCSSVIESSYIHGNFLSEHVQPWSCTFYKHLTQVNHTKNSHCPLLQLKWHIGEVKFQDWNTNPSWSRGLERLRTLKHKLAHETLRELEGRMHLSLLPWDCLALYICWLSTAQCTWMARLSLALAQTHTHKCRQTLQHKHTHYRKSHDMNSDPHPASALIKDLWGQTDWLKENIIHLVWFGFQYLHKV